MKTVEALNKCMELEEQRHVILYFIMLNDDDILNTLYETLTAKQLSLLLDNELLNYKCELIEMNYLVLIANVSYGCSVDKCFCIKITTE